MSLRTTPERTRRPDAILVAYAHPDDESFGPAALLAKYARAGTRVYSIVATRGQHGEAVPDLEASVEEFGRLREGDLREAAAEIGFTHIDILPYEDGTLDRLPENELLIPLVAALHHYRPDVLLTFGPAGITRHPDHLAVHRAVQRAFWQIRATETWPAELYYDAVPAEWADEMGIAGALDGSPNTRIDVSETQLVKLSALRRHARHVQDARKMIARLERQPQNVTTLYRAWPAVPSGQIVTALRQDETPGR